MAILDVVDRIRGFVEPTPETGLRVDVTCTEPLLVEASTVYAFETAHRFVQIETTDAPSREDWGVLVVYVSALTDEESMQERQREVTLALAERRDQWVSRLLEHEADEVYGTLVDVRADYDYIRNLGVRGIGVRCDGYRVL